MLDCVIVGIGGFIGTICRYAIGLIPVKETNLFPIKTFLINIFGAFIIGCISAYIAKQTADARTVLFLKVGLCGGFTTFSSFALETADLIKSGNMKIALMYALLSVAVGIMAVFFAEILTEKII